MKVKVVHETIRENTHSDYREFEIELNAAIITIEAQHTITDVKYTQSSARIDGEDYPYEAITAYIHYK